MSIIGIIIADTDSRFVPIIILNHAQPITHHTIRHRGPSLLKLFVLGNIQMTVLTMKLTLKVIQLSFGMTSVLLVALLAYLEKRRQARENK